MTGVFLDGFGKTRTIATMLAFVVLITSCSSDPTEVLVGLDDDTGVDTDFDASDAGGPVAADSPPVPIETTTTTEVPVTTFEVPGTTAVGSRQRFDVLGDAMLGVGEWVVMRPSGDGEDECPDGALAYQVEGQVVHLYEELSFAGGIRLFNGTRGQDAFVINCEESVERVLIQGSALLPEQGWPELDEIRLYEPDTSVHMEFLADFAWRGDVFSAFGTDFSLGATDLYGFDVIERSVDPLGARFGERADPSSTHGADIVVPNGWELSDEASVFSFSSFSRVQINRLDGVAPEPLAEGDDFLSSDSVRVRLWSAPEADGHSSVTAVVNATDWTFLTADGVRVVRQVPTGQATVEIELFADDADSAVDQDLPWLVLDTLRVFDKAAS